MRYSVVFPDEEAAEGFIEEVLSSKGIAPSNQVHAVKYVRHEQALYVTQAGLITVKKEPQQGGTWLVTIES